MNLKHLGSFIAAPAMFTLLLLPLSPLRADSDTPMVSLSGALDSVDADGAHAVLITDSGLRYTLDIAQTDITSHGASVKVDVLGPGEKIQTDGEPLPDGTIRADRIQILSPTSTIPKSPNVATGDASMIHLRGTLVSVDQRAGSFVVQVNDHTRTVFEDDSTDVSLSDQGGSTPGDVIPLAPGERVTVSGTIRRDGTVVADTVEVGTTESQAVDLTGRILQPSSRYYTRDIKIREETGQVVTVHVPHDIPIVRNGRQLSVHDLSDTDVVHIEGIPDDNAVQATHIEVVTGSTGNF